jgi:hypothetical protein
MIDRAIGMAGIAFAILGIVMVTLFPQINRKLAWAGFALGLTLLVIAGILIFLPDGKAQAPGGVTFNGNCNNYGNNNFNCNTIIAPNRAEFTSGLGADLVSHMPTKKKVRLVTVGADEDQRVGNDFQTFLKDKGYTIEREIVGVLAPPPNHPFAFNDTPDAYVVTIAPSSH